MIYRVEYFPNPHVVSIHVRVRLIGEQFISSLTEAKTTEGRDLYSLITSIEGVDSGLTCNTSLLPYEIHLGIAKAFDRAEVINSVMDCLLVWLRMKGLILPDELLEKGPDIRSDISYHQCAQCRKEQEEMFKDI